MKEMWNGMCKNIILNKKQKKKMFTEANIYG